MAAQIVSVAANQIRARVPFGAATGAVRVRTSQGEAQSNFSMRTSVSGFIEEVFRQPDGQLGRRPVANITVRLRPPQGPAITQKTGADGTFVLADAPPGLHLIEIDTGAASAPYPSRTLKARVLANRDNQFPSTIELQSVETTGQNSLSSNLGSQGGGMVTVNPGGSLPTTFGLPAGCQVTSPPSGPVNRLTISLFELGRAPASMPPGYFGDAVGQITPFGAVMTPGGTLRLPNTADLPVGTTVKLFRYDQPTEQTPDSPSVGSFVEVGIGRVTPTGQIEASEDNTATRVTQTTFYFASQLYPTAIISGRVVASDGSPVGRALAQVRGQSVFTNSDGTFTLENIPVTKSGDTVPLEVSYMRPDRMVDRVQRGSVAISADVTTALNSDIVLSGRLSPDQPLLIAPPRLTVNENQTLDFSLLAVSQPVAGQSVQVTASGAGFASILAGANDVFTLRLTPGANTGGEYNILITATNNAGVKSQQTISVRVRKPPSNKPTANDQCVIASPGVARDIALTGSDPLGRQIQLSLLSQPSGGTISGSLPNITYTPRSIFTGLDVFTYRAVVNGTSALSEPALVYVIVR